MTNQDDELRKELIELLLIGSHSVDNALLDDLQSLIRSRERAARIDEIETLRKSMRGEDPDQYRPGDMVSMSYVEEVIDAHIAMLGDV